MTVWKILSFLPCYLPNRDWYPYILSVVWVINFFCLFLCVSTQYEAHVVKKEVWNSFAVKKYAMETI